MAEAAAAAAAIMQAIKASGVLVRVEPRDFQTVLNKQEEPLVVRAPGGLFRGGWCYLVSFKGLAFFTRSREPLPLSGRTLLIDAKSIWVPS